MGRRHLDVLQEDLAVAEARTAIFSIGCRA